MSRRSKRDSHKKQPKLSQEVPPEALKLCLDCTQAFLAATALQGAGWEVSPAVTESEEGSPSTYDLKLESWSQLPDLLAWFAIGSSADSTASLRFPASLPKDLRAQVHNCVALKQQLQSLSQGVGGERHVSVLAAAAGPAAAGRGGSRSAITAQREEALVLYRLARQEGLGQYSRDEVAEMVLKGTLTGELQQLMSGPLFQQQQAIRHLCLAASCGDVERVQALLQQHPQVLQQPGLQDLSTGAAPTPLHLAAAAGQLEVVKLLLAAGADVAARNGVGQTALQVAQHQEECDIEAALMQAGAVDERQDAWQDIQDGP